MLVHSSIHKRGIQEYEDIVVGASSYSLDDLKEMRLYSWAFLTLQNLGILEHVANYYNQYYNLPRMKFYEIFLDFCRKQESIFSEEYGKIRKFTDNGYAGKGWDHHDLELGDIIWPIEEASWLRLARNKQKLLDGINLLLNYLENKCSYHTSSNILKDLAKFQVFLLTTRDDPRDVKTENFEFDWKNFFVNNAELKQVQKNYYFKNLLIEKDPIRWGYKVIWYGRRSNLFKCHPENLQDEHEKVMISSNGKESEQIVNLIRN